MKIAQLEDLAHWLEDLRIFGKAKTPENKTQAFHLSASLAHRIAFLKLIGR